MAKKNLKIIKTLNKIAEDIDNISLNDPGAWGAVTNGAVAIGIGKHHPTDVIVGGGSTFDRVGMLVGFGNWAEHNGYARGYGLAAGETRMGHKLVQL